MATSTFAGNGNRGSGSTLRKSAAAKASRTERRSASVIGFELAADPADGIGVPVLDAVLGAGTDVVAGAGLSLIHI